MKSFRLKALWKVFFLLLIKCNLIAFQHETFHLSLPPPSQLLIYGIRWSRWHCELLSIMLTDVFLDTDYIFYNHFGFAFFRFQRHFGILCSKLLVNMKLFARQINENHFGHLADLERYFCPTPSQMQILFFNFSSTTKKPSRLTKNLWTQEANRKSWWMSRVSFPLFGSQCLLVWLVWRVKMMSVKDKTAQKKSVKSGERWKSKRQQRWNGENMMSDK